MSTPKKGAAGLAPPAVSPAEVPEATDPLDVPPASAASPPAGIPMPMPGQQPTPEQLAVMQQQLQAEAAKHGMTVPQFVNQLRQQQQEQVMRRMQAVQEQIMAQNGGKMPLGPDGRPIKIGMTPNGQPIPIVVAPNGQPIPVAIGPNGQVIPIRPPSQGGPPGSRPGSAAGSPPGENLTVEQLEERKRMVQQQMQAQLAQQQAALAAMTPEQRAAFQQQLQQKQTAMQVAMQQQQGRGPQPQEIRPGPPNPVALALMKFLRGQDLKPRSVIMDDVRREMFKVKRALRAIQSPAYEKARKKNPLLPEITDRASLENTFKLLPMSMLALRVAKQDPHAGHNHGPGGHAGKKTKRVKGLWTVGIVKQQDAEDEMYYIWMHEGSQVKTKLYAALALVLIFLVVLYPLWPLKLRQGVYYLSWGFLGLLGLFFAMAIFRVILFCLTYILVPPGLWLYPNLWEDVSFMDSFRPVWAWHDPNPKKKKSKKNKAVNTSATAHMNAAQGLAPPSEATTTATDTQIKTESSEGATHRAPYAAPEVEEVAE